MTVPNDQPEVISGETPTPEKITPKAPNNTVYEEIANLKTGYQGILMGIANLVQNFTEFKTLFDKDGDKRLSAAEIREAMKNPIGKRYLVIFLWLSFNVGMMIFRFKVTGNMIDEWTLGSFLAGSSCVVFAGWIENVNASLNKIKDQRIENLRDENLESSKLINNQAGEIQRLNERVKELEDHYKFEETIKAEVKKAMEN